MFHTSLLRPNARPVAAPGVVKVFDKSRFEASDVHRGAHAWSRRLEQLAKHREGTPFSPCWGDALCRWDTHHD
ncbi:hypothetical protein XCV4009 [Xanthomonas euvesicatoria pv. vesicatoria str. 85-10]|uniref:Uncharacterized protein n=3 Tax=Xanthomonas TaxID=338 RepID=Q3BNC3_XANE5|nr:hypothetical protein XCV4009 [Xanthomonas euvesicatoria pv. vesicatoria str. 85-10]